MWLIVLLILVGVLLLVAELVLLPGISVAGIGSLLSFIGAVFLGYMNYGFWTGSGVLTAVILLSMVAVIVSLRANTWRRLSLHTTIDSTSTFTPQQHDIRIGQQGVTLTRLAPMGKVRFGEVTLEAKSIDAYIDPRQPVEAIAFDNTVVIVRLLNERHENKAKINIHSISKYTS